MSLVVETGSGLSTAEALASVADFRAYFASVGVDVTALTDTQVEQALRKATFYLEQKYRFRWKGCKLTTTQVLSWPRAFVEIKDAINFYGNGIVYIPQNEIPKPVIYSCCELAYKSTFGDLFTDTKQQVISQTVGPITTVYDKYSAQHTQYSAIDAWLQPFLKFSGSGTPMVRV
jgi:hypothetical protein